LPQTESVQVDENFYQLLELFSIAAKEENVPWLMVGATARVLLLEKVYGWPKGIATEDTDFAVQVESWAHYEKLCHRLSEQGDLKPLQKPTKRFVTSKNLLFDLVPFGGVETGIKQVYWPPHNDDLMTVRGFASAYTDAICVNVNKTIEVPVISPAALCALKLFAWEERHTQHPGRDAKDLAYLFQNIESLFSAEEMHNKYQQALIENDYDIELASLYQFGQTVKELLDPDDSEFLQKFINSEVEQEDDSILVRELQKYLPAKDIGRVVHMLQSFYKPFT